MGELAKINQGALTEIVQSLPGHVDWIQRNHDKGINKGVELLNSITSNGGRITTREQYDEVGKYLENAKKAKAAMLERRSPVTQLMDSYRKVFTSLENDFDEKNLATVPGQLKAMRDRYAADAERARQQKAREAQEQALAEQALETYKAGVREECYAHMKYLCDECAKLMKKQFDAITLKNYYAIKTYIENFKEEVTKGMMIGKIQTECHVKVPENLPNGLSRDFNALQQIRMEVYNSCESELMMSFTLFCRKTKQNYLDLMVAKKQQLELAEKDAAKAAEQEAEIKRKLAEDAAKAEQERKETEAKERQKAEMEAQQRIAMGLFGSMEQAGVDTGVKTKTKKVLRITSKQAFLSLLNYWWLNEGQSLDIDELSKTFKKMITYAEKRANAKESEMVTGEGIEFIDEVTAK